MDNLYLIFSWGTPVGTGSFLLLLALSAAIFMWGLSKVSKGSDK